MGDILEAGSRIIKWIVIFIMLFMVWQFWTGCNPKVESINNCENANETLIEMNDDMARELKVCQECWLSPEDCSYYVQ